MARHLQILLALTCGNALVFLYFQGLSAALAAAYGGLIALCNLALMAWRAKRIERAGSLSAQQSLRHLYLSALERFASVAFLFALGFGPLQLAPLPVLIGFAITLPALLSFNVSGSGRIENNG